MFGFSSNTMAGGWPRGAARRGAERRHRLGHGRLGQKPVDGGLIEPDVLMLSSLLTTLPTDWAACNPVARRNRRRASQRVQEWRGLSGAWTEGPNRHHDGVIRLALGSTDDLHRP